MQENKIIFEGYKQVKEITSGCYGCAFVDKTNMCIKRIAVYCTENNCIFIKENKKRRKNAWETISDYFEDHYEREDRNGNDMVAVS